MIVANRHAVIQIERDVRKPAVPRQRAEAKEEAEGRRQKAEGRRQQRSRQKATELLLPSALLTLPSGTGGCRVGSPDSVMPPDRTVIEAVPAGGAEQGELTAEKQLSVAIG